MNANNISNGNIPNSGHNRSGYDTPPPIRNEYDVLSCALHQHGYWPDHSLIILTATDNTLGPSLRVNLPDEPCTLPERADFLHETFTKLPTHHNGETLTRFYAIIIDGDNTVRQRQLHPNTAQLAAIEEIQQDVDTQIPINAWLHLLHDPRIVSELRCEDVIYAGSASIWALNPEQQTLTLLAPIEELRHSDYYTWLTRHGDTIAATAQHNYAHSPWDTDPTTNPETRHDWENAVELWDHTHTTRHDEARQGVRTIYRQAQIDLCYWDAAINAAAHLLTTHPVDNAGNPTTGDAPTIGDALRELIPAEVAGHLRASIAPATLNPITAEMLTYLAGYGLNHAQKALAYLHYSAQYTYHAFGGEYPSTSPDRAPLEPPHYGTRITRKTYIPASFTHALSATAGTEQAHVRAVPEKCVQWQDWIRRTHRAIQQNRGIQQVNLDHWALQELSPADLAVTTELNTINREVLPRLLKQRDSNDHTAARKLEEISQQIDDAYTNSEYLANPNHQAVYTHYLDALKGELGSPHWERLNGLELLTSLLTPHSTDGEYATLRNTQAWANWYKGYSTYARLLRQEAHRHTTGEDLNILDVHLNAGGLPAWIKHTICGEPGANRQPISTLKPRKV